MAKVFRSWDVDQGWLLPPSLHEFVPPGHMAHFVRDTVREALDLSAILDTYTEERGYPPYHPGMMVALLLYGYSRGLYSSRQLARACEERVDVMAVTGLNRPDFRTIAEFRKRHLVALSDLFVQVLRLCRAAGLVQFAHVAVDGTKLKVNASRHKAMSYGRMKTTEPALAAEVEAWLDRAGEADTVEDQALSADRRGDQTPDWMADKQRRLEVIRAAKAALEAEAADPPDPEDESGPGASSGMRWQGRPLRGDDGGPPDRAQRNFTDPDSRILPTRDGFVQGYNGQIAVDATHQVIVAYCLVTNSADHRALVPLLDGVRAHLGRKPREASSVFTPMWHLRPAIFLPSSYPLAAACGAFTVWLSITAAEGLASLPTRSRSTISVRSWMVWNSNRRASSRNQPQTVRPCRNARAAFATGSPSVQ
jgi:transposase